MVGILAPPSVHSDTKPWECFFPHSSLIGLAVGARPRLAFVFAAREVACGKAIYSGCWSRVPVEDQDVAPLWSGWVPGAPSELVRAGKQKIARTLQIISSRRAH
jgi:hypothetical protein